MKALHSYTLERKAGMNKSNRTENSAVTARKNTERMGNAPIFPLLLSMAVPGLLGTLTTYLYRTVDQIFVGNFVGRNALGGISVLSPFNNVVIALTLFITVGGASMLSLAMGRQDFDKANKLFTNIIIQAVGMAAAVSVLFCIFAEPFVGMCGAKEGSQVYDYAVVYLRITSIGQILNMLNVGLAAVIRSEGNTKYSMFANMVGAVLNVFLNFLLMVVFPLGIAGAAIATVGSQLAGAVFSAAYFFSGRSNLKWAGFGVVDIRQMVTIAKMGIAPSIFQMLSFVTNIMINKSLQHYGDLDPYYSLIGGGELCISALSVVNTVEQFIISTASGINQAAAPVISYNYGRKSFRRVRRAALTSQAMAFAFAVVIWTAMMLAPEFVIQLFSKNDAQLLDYGMMAMRTSKCLALFGGYQMLVSMYFSSIGKPEVATLVSLSRHGIFFIPALILLPKFFGLMGVLYATPVSDGCSLIVVTTMYAREMLRLGRLKEGESFDDRSWIARFFSRDKRIYKKSA